MHECGIAHRDIKPENMLLDEDGNLKLTDFGMATLYRKGSVRRRLRTRCGTALYMAPQVLAESYEGDEADLWSCAVVLFVMLLGCHPWEEASPRCPHYKRFASPKATHNYPPWDRLPSAACHSLLERMLQSDPAARPTLSKVLSHPWVAQPNPLSGADMLCSDPAALFRFIAGDNLPSPLLALTQPELLPMPFSVLSHLQAPRNTRRPPLAFSQPIPSPGDAAGPQNTPEVRYARPPARHNRPRRTRPRRARLLCG